MGDYKPNERGREERESVCKSSRIHVHVGFLMWFLIKEVEIESERERVGGERGKDSIGGRACVCPFGRLLCS